jgi:hypothetical protein
MSAVLDVVMFAVSCFAMITVMVAKGLVLRGEVFATRENR